MRRYIYKDALVAASSDARVFVRNDDAFAPLAGAAALSFLHLSTGARAPAFSYPLALARGAGASAWFCANASVDVLTAACPPWSALLPAAGCAADGSDCVALLEVRDAAGALVADNFELLAPPAALRLPAAAVTFALGAPAADGSVPVTLSASATALFVTLTTLAQGRFSDNALILGPGNTTVAFLPWEGFDAGVLASSLRVEHLGAYARN